MTRLARLAEAQAAARRLVEDGVTDHPSAVGNASSLGPSALVTLAGCALAGCAFPAASGPVGPDPATPRVEYLEHQEILTPLPLRVSLPSHLGAEHVLVLVKLWGLRDWSSLELHRSGQTWSGEVSCRAVSTITGDTRYFVLALDGEGRTVVSSGSPGFPHVATIVGKLPEGPRALPGDPAPLRCHDPADCPPDFPGCPAYAVARPRCSADDDCPGAARCAWDGYCDAGPPRDLGEQASEEERLAAAVRKATRRYANVSKR